MAVVRTHRGLPPAAASCLVPGRQGVGYNAGRIRPVPLTTEMAFGCRPTANALYEYATNSTPSEAALGCSARMRV